MKYHYRGMVLRRNYDLREYLQLGLLRFKICILSPLVPARTDFKVTTSDSKGDLFLNMDLVQSCNAAEIVSNAESSEKC